MKNKILEIKNKNFKTGFTLIELMIVITVIAILATMMLFGLGAAQKNARDVQREQIAKGIQTALQQYASDNGSYPTAALAANWATLTAAAGPLNPYLPAGMNDPCTKTNVRGVASITCPAGGGTVTYNYDVGAGAAVASPVVASCTGSQYRIWIGKESGGAARFCGPQ